MNKENTKIMVFRKGGRLAERECWFLEGTRLQIVNKYKYLGFVFSTRLSFNAMHDDVSCKGEQKMYKCCVHYGEFESLQ